MSFFPAPNVKTTVLTSITVPLVITPSCVYIGDWGFFFTPMIGRQNVAFNYMGTMGSIRNQTTPAKFCKSLFCFWFVWISLSVGFVCLFVCLFVFLSAAQIWIQTIHSTKISPQGGLHGLFWIVDPEIKKLKTIHEHHRDKHVFTASQGNLCRENLKIDCEGREWGVRRTRGD